MWGKKRDATPKPVKVKKPKRRAWAGVLVDESAGTINYDGETYSLPAHASIETAGEIRKRVTATRLVATGVFAFALKKKEDDRTIFLTVEGDGWAFVASMPLSSGTLAMVDRQQGMEFAAYINSWRPASGSSAQA